jgi:hypothetical protein
MPQVSTEEVRRVIAALELDETTIRALWVSLAQATFVRSVEEAEISGSSYLRWACERLAVTGSGELGRGLPGSVATKLPIRKASTVSEPTARDRARSCPDPSYCGGCDRLVGLEADRGAAEGRADHAGRPGGGLEPGVGRQQVLRHNRALRNAPLAAGMRYWPPPGRRRGSPGHPDQRSHQRRHRQRHPRRSRSRLDSSTSRWPR